MGVLAHVLYPEVGQLNQAAIKLLFLEVFLVLLLVFSGLWYTVYFLLAVMAVFERVFILRLHAVVRHIQLLTVGSPFKDIFFVVSCVHDRIDN